MNIYIVCPVRLVDGAIVPEVAEYVAALEAEGHHVHYPPRDVDQTDPTGEDICFDHWAAMRSADRCDVFWDVNSKGSHFDIGMAWALGVPFKIVKMETPDTVGKSYVKVMQSHQWRA